MTLVSSIKKDIKWRLADPMSLVLWIGIPLLIGGLMSLVTGGGSGHVPKAKVLLVDEDDSILSFLAGAVGGSSGSEFLDVELVDREEGRRRIDEGDGSALLMIPKGFSQAVIDDTPTELTLLTNPSQRILPKIIEQGLEILVDASFYLQKTAGEFLREMSKGPPKGQSFFSDVKTAAFAARVNKRLRSLEKVLFPPVLSVEDDDRDLRDPDGGAKKKQADSGFNIGLLLFPGILFMALMFIAQGMSYDVWRERDQGTLRRLLCSPSGATNFLLAKVITATIVMAVVTLIGLLLGFATFGIPGAPILGALVWCAFAGGSLMVFFMVVQMLASTSRSGNIMSTAVLFPLMMIGGTFFPFEAMPVWMADIGKFTPNGMAIVQLKAMLAGELETGALIRTAALLSGFTLVFYAIGLKLLTTRFGTS